MRDDLMKRKDLEALVDRLYVDLTNGIGRKLRWRDIRAAELRDLQDGAPDLLEVLLKRVVDGESQARKGLTGDAARKTVIAWSARMREIADLLGQASRKAASDAEGLIGHANHMTAESHFALLRQMHEDHPVPKLKRR